MARILAVDWDSVEVRFVLGNVAKDKLTVLKVGSASVQSLSEEAPRKDSESGKSDSEPVDGASGDTEISDVTADVPMTLSDENVKENSGEQSDDQDDDVSAEKDKTTDGKTEEKADSSQIKIGAVLKKLLKENHVGGGTTVLAAQRSQLEFLSLTLPVTTESLLPEMVKNQVLRDSTTYVESSPLDFMSFGPIAGQEGQQRVAAFSMTRANIKELRQTLSAAGRRMQRLELRGPALVEFIRTGKYGLLPGEPVLLVQEVCDEVDFVIFDDNHVVYLRSIKIQTGLSVEERVQRLNVEILRTIAAGMNDLANKTLGKVVFFNAETDTELLAESLAESEIALEPVNPFTLVRCSSHCVVPERAGRYAALIGMILAETQKNRPLIDLLHPHEKPKPPNYLLGCLVTIVAMGSVVAGIWYWNKIELAKQADEIAALEKSRDDIAGQLNSTFPLFSVLNNAKNWDDAYGIIVLDELRDITLRLPKAPDLVVTRLSYNGSYQGRPVFIISAKITKVEIYQQFRQMLIGDRSHMLIQSPGPINNPGGGGYKYEFNAVIVCQRRPYAAYISKLPPELQKISNQPPEMIKARQEQFQKQREEQMAKQQQMRQQQMQQLRQQQMQNQQPVTPNSMIPPPVSQQTDPVPEQPDPEQPAPEQLVPEQPDLEQPTPEVVTESPAPPETTPNQ